MGSSESSAELNANQDQLAITSQGLTQVPFSIPATNNLHVLDLTDNKIQRLPTKLKKLTSLLLKENNLHEITSQMEKAIRKMSELTMLDVSSNHLKIVPSFLAHLPLKRLGLSNNQIEELNVKFAGLEILDISQNRLVKIPDLPHSIIGLSIDFNIIEVLDVSLPNIKILNCSMNRISRFADNIMFSNLETINLDQNRLENCPNLREIAPKLQTLNLNQNFLKEIPLLPISIQNLFLNANQIEVIPEWVAELENLSQFEINGNKLTDIPPLPPSITSLSMFENKIEFISQSSLPKLTKSFYMNNNLKELPCFVDTVLQNLYAGLNLIEEINPVYLPETITRLIIPQNKIKSIPDQLFEFKQLVYLNVAENELTGMPDSILNSGLMYLNIAGNKMKRITFPFPPSILVIQCSDCGLQELPDGFEFLPNLTILTANNNNIAHIPQMRSISKLSLSRNRITEMPYLSPLIKALDLSCNEIKQVTELKLQNLTDLDLSHNLLTELPDLGMCDKLQYLKLSHNRIVGKLDIKQFPYLDSIDIAFTKILLGTPSTKIREIVASCSKLISSPQIKLFTSSKVGYAEMCGERESMEDAIVVRKNLINDDTGLYAVFDGHGGSQSANFCACQIVKEFTGIKEDINMEIVASHVNNVIEALRQQKLDDGCTMATAVISPTKIICCHIGDSRILVISKNGTVRHASKDHKPTDIEEIDRILEMNGKIVNSRVNGILAVSRSIGDFGIYGVGHEPTITELIREENDKYVVICCDGVFDVVFNEDIGRMAAESDDPTKLAYDIRNLSSYRMSQDNISCIVIPLINDQQYQSQDSVNAQ